MTKKKENKPKVQKKHSYLPQGWQEIPLGEVCESPISGYSPVGTDRPAQDDEVGVLKLSCIQGSRFSPGKNKAVEGSKANDLKTPVRKNTLIVSRSNTEALVGAVCYMDNDFPNLFLSDLLWCVSAKDNDRIDLKWLAYLLSFAPYRAKIIARANGTSETMKKINKPGFLGIQILYPKLNEQKKIAKILSTWDTAIDQTCKLITTKKQRKKALMQQLLTGKKRLPGFGIPTDKHQILPEGWNALHAKELFKAHTKKNCENEPVLSVTQGNGVIYRETFDRKIESSSNSLSAFKLVEPGDFVISLRSFQGGLEYSQYRGIVSPAYHVIRPIKKIDDVFYKYLFKSRNFIGHLAISVIGIRDGKQVNYSDFSFLQLPYPPFKEQKAIGKVLMTADREIFVLESKLRGLEKQKRGLMQKLLTGEVRVKT
jgi:type I restriction enzyme, S subunit